MESNTSSLAAVTGFMEGNANYADGDMDSYIAVIRPMEDRIYVANGNMEARS
jgi:hypothetical protein